MRLLEITDREHSQFEELFEEAAHIGIEDIAPEVIEGRTDVKVDGRSISEYDAAYLEIPSKNAVFGRVLLEMIQDQDVRVNYPSTGFFIMAKKNYLYYVLHEKDIKSPDTIVVADRKAIRNLDREIEYPVIGQRFSGMSMVERHKLFSHEDVEDLAEGVEYGDEVLIFQEAKEGDKYKCMAAGGQLISLEDRTEGWRVVNDKLQYSTLPGELKDRVRGAMNAIGTEYGEFILQGGHIIDINPNPDLELYTELSGKNAFESVAKVLRE